MKAVLLIIIFSMLISCGNDPEKQKKVEGSNSSSEEKIGTVQSSDVMTPECNPTKNECDSKNGPNSSIGNKTITCQESGYERTQNVYELKEDGVYIYCDGEPIIEELELGCKKIVQKNFKYIRVPSYKDSIKQEEGLKVYQDCKVKYECKDDLGKPSLKELGYERHKEREIKPEDNRFGISKEVSRDTSVTEPKIESETIHFTLPKTSFKELSQKEFIENGIVIIGKHISRVVVKSLDEMPKINDRVVVVSSITKHFNCKGEEIRKDTIAPKELADFKRIKFKENIFEFIEEKPLPDDAAYLSDEELMKLTNNVYKFTPRIYDKTIDNVAYYNPGEYIIEYYNGGVFYDYQCIRITNAGTPPRLWDKLNRQPPTASAKITPSNEKCYLILEEFSSEAEAEKFTRKKPFGDALLYKFPDGRYAFAVPFENRRNAEKEMKRYINMGFKGCKIKQY